MMVHKWQRKPNRGGQLLGPRLQPGPGPGLPGPFGGLGIHIFPHFYKLPLSSHLSEVYLSIYLYEEGSRVRVRVGISKEVCLSWGWICMWLCDMV